MRLQLQGRDDTVAPLPDQLFLFSNNGSFTIASYVSLGYNKLDAYIVGGGGGGGKGGLGYGNTLTNLNSQLHAGGAGGGGAGGALRTIKAADLLSMAGTEPITVGQGGAGSSTGSGSAGGSSTFHGLTAYGGGGGGQGRDATSSAIGDGGPGGAGGGRNATGATPTIPLGSQALGQQGGGSGGLPGTVSNRATAGAKATQYTDTTDFGGGGGGGGGCGTSMGTPSSKLPYAIGGKGGAGRYSVGGNNNYRGSSFYNGDTGLQMFGGNPGAGGGGANLFTLLGYPNLLGTGGWSPPDPSSENPPGNLAPGGGGAGGMGLVDSTGSTDPRRGGAPGKEGCVLIRIYRL